MSKYEFKALDKEKAAVLLNERGIIVPKLENALTLAEIFHYEDYGYEIQKKSII